jgi:hypothetical protein
MKDPFEEFLEDAMSGPDLELGHEMRRRLLEAAVAGEAVDQENVVRMDRSDPEVQQGFNWILGEAPAAEPLMSRMISDPAFLDSLDGDRRFVRTLRQVLVKQAEVVAPAARRRFLPALAVSSAAAIALAAGALFFNSSGSRAVPVVAKAEVQPHQEKIIPAAPMAAIVEAEASAGQPVEVAMVEKEDAPVLELPPSGPSALIPEPHAEMSEEVTAIAGIIGSGQSISPEDQVLPGGGGSSFSLQSVAAVAAEVDAPLQDSALTLLDSGSGQEPSLAFHSDRGGMWDAGFTTGLSGTGGPNMSLIGGDREGTIPEPGVTLPVMIGMMVLFLRRNRKLKS